MWERDPIAAWDRNPPYPILHTGPIAAWDWVAPSALLHPQSMTSSYPTLRTLEPIASWSGGFPTPLTLPTRR